MDETDQVLYLPFQPARPPLQGSRVERPRNKENGNDTHRTPEQSAGDSRRHRKAARIRDNSRFGARAERRWIAEDVLTGFDTGVCRAGRSNFGIRGAFAAMRGLQQQTGGGMLHSGAAAPARQLPLPWLCARVSAKSVVVKNVVRLMDGIGDYAGVRVVQAPSLGLLVDLPEPPVIDFDNRVLQNIEEKEAMTIRIKEEEDEEVSLQAETASTSRKQKKPWTGPIRAKRSPARPPHTEEECARRVDNMLYELEEDGVTGAWAVANVLDAWVGKVTRVDLSKVIRELGSRRNPTLALEVFQWMQVQKGRLKPNGHTYSLVLGVLGRGGMVTEARALFDLMLSSNVDVGVYSFNAMIGAYARSGNFKKAWRLYEDMLERRVQADEVTLSTLLNGAGKADLPVEKAEMIFLRIKQNGIVPSVQTYNTLISVLKRRGLAARCTELHDEMHSMEVVPDLCTFNTLLTMHVQGGRFDEAMDVYQRLRNAGLQPTAVTYTGLIQMYSRGGKHKEAIEVFLEMQRLGCKPDLTTYTLMITVYGKAGSPEEAALVFRQLQQTGSTPNVVTWSSLMQVFGWQGRVQEIGAYFNEMLAAGCLPDVTLYNVVMGAYGRHGHSVEAAILFRRMQAQGLTPGAVSYDTMIQAYCHSRQPADARAVLEQMTKAGFSPDRVSRAMLKQQLGVKYPGGSQSALSRKERRRMAPFDRA